MAQSVKCFGDIRRHGDVHMTSRVVPVELEAKVTGPGPVDRDGIFGGKSSKKMVGVGFAKVFDAKIINSESEGGATIGVTPKTWSVWDWMITVWGKMCLELIVGKYGGFFESVHAFADFDIDVSLGIEIILRQVVLGNDFWGKVLAVDAHVLVDDHVGDKKEVFNVASAVAGTEMGVGDDTVQMEFGVDEANGRRADILVGVETVATDSHAKAVDLGFTGAHCAHEISISDFATSGDLVRQDEEHGVVAGDLFADGARFS